MTIFSMTTTVTNTVNMDICDSDKVTDNVTISMDVESERVPEDSSSQANASTTRRRVR